MTFDALPSPQLTLAIAGITIAIPCSDTALADALARRYADFRTTAAPQWTVYMTLTRTSDFPSLLDLPPQFNGDFVRFRGHHPGTYIDGEHSTARLVVGPSEPFNEAEYFLRIVVALVAFRAGGLMFHGAGIVRNGAGHVFFGYSGSGKTTVSRLSPHDLVLNDDLVVLLPYSTGWTMHATPFSNPTQVQPAGNHHAPLRAMWRLVQDTRVFAEPMGAGQALAELVSNVPVLSTDAARSPALLLRCQHLWNALPVRRLHFLRDDSFWRVVEAE